MSLLKCLITAVIAALLSCSAIAQKSADEQVEKTLPGKWAQIVEQIQLWGEQVREVREQHRLQRALDEARSSVPVNETRKFEVVTKGGDIQSGGSFVRVQPYAEGGRLLGPGEVVSRPVELGGGLELPGSSLTPAQKKEMKDRLEQQRKSEQLLKDAEEAQKKLKEAAEAAEKARLVAAEQKRAAEEAARTAAEAQAAKIRAEKQAKEAAAAEERALRDGARVQASIAAERARYRAAGGIFRAPASEGGGAN